MSPVPGSRARSPRSVAFAPRTRRAIRSSAFLAPPRHRKGHAATGVLSTRSQRPLRSTRRTSVRDICVRQVAYLCARVRRSAAEDRRRRRGLPGFASRVGLETIVPSRIATSSTRSPNRTRGDPRLGGAQGATRAGIKSNESYILIPYGRKALRRVVHARRPNQVAVASRGLSGWNDRTRDRRRRRGRVRRGVRRPTAINNRRRGTRDRTVVIARYGPARACVT